MFYLFLIPLPFCGFICGKKYRGMKRKHKGAKEEYYDAKENANIKQNAKSWMKMTKAQRKI
jgi:hypothetical protein